MDSALSCLIDALSDSSSDTSVQTMIESLEECALRSEQSTDETQHHHLSLQSGMNLGQESIGIPPLRKFRDAELAHLHGRITELELTAGEQKMEIVRLQQQLELLRSWSKLIMQKSQAEGRRLRELRKENKELKATQSQAVVKISRMLDRLNNQHPSATSVEVHSEAEAIASGTEVPTVFIGAFDSEESNVAKARMDNSSQGSALSLWLDSHIDHVDLTLYF